MTTSKDRILELLKKRSKMAVRVGKGGRMGAEILAIHEEDWDKIAEELDDMMGEEFERWKNKDGIPG